MNTKINNVKKALQNMQMKVVEVTKTNYTLENGDVYEIHLISMNQSQ